MSDPVWEKNLFIFQEKGLFSILLNWLVSLSYLAAACAIVKRFLLQ